MSNKFLTKEIVQHILVCFGAGVFTFGKTGLTYPDLLSNKTIKIKYENELEIDHPIYAGQDKIGDLLFQGLLVKLSLEEDPSEYHCVFCLQNQVIYGLSFNGEEESGNFKVWDKAGWVNAPIATQGAVLSGVETAISGGLTWKPLDNLDALYAPLVKLIEQGE